MKGPVTLVALALVATMPLPAAAITPSTTPREPSYDGLVRIANLICIAPAEYGGTLSGGARVGANISPTKLGAGAVLSRILSQFISVNLSGSLKVNGTAWYGILQRDLDQAQRSRNACAERVFDHLFDTFHISNKSDFKVINKPPSAPAVYQRINNNITSAINSKSINIENSGGVQLVVDGSGNHLINGNGNTVTEVTKADRSHYIKLLQEAYGKGSDILTSLQRGPVTNASISTALDKTNLWLSAVYSQLATEMTPVAAKNFINVQPTSHVYSGPTAEVLTPASITAYANLRDAMPAYLENLKYLMEHETMDPQNAGN